MAFVKSNRREAYEKLITALRADAVLRREVKGWAVGLGGKEEDNLQPSTLTRPYLRAYPTTGKAERVDKCSILSPLIVVLEISLNGTDQRALLDLWEHLEGVVLAMPVRTWDLGVTSVTPQLGKSRIGEDNSLNALATITLEQYLEV